MALQKQYCENWYIGNSHYNNRCWKRCKSVAIKELNGKKLCINCFNKLNNNINK